MKKQPMSTQKIRVGMVIVVLLATLVLLLQIIPFSKQRNDTSAVQQVADGDAIRQARIFTKAVAEAESEAFNGSTAGWKESLKLWQQLIDEYPSEASLELNYCLTYTELYEEVQQRLDTQALDGKELTDLAAFCDSNFDDTMLRLDELAVERVNDDRIALMRARLLSAPSRFRNTPSQPKLEAAISVLHDALVKHPGSAVLATQLYDICEIHTTPEADKLLVESLLVVSKQNPENNFLAALCGKRLLRQKDPRVSEIVYRLHTASQESKEFIELNLHRLPESFLRDALKSIEENDWRNARKIEALFLLMLSSSSQRSDLSSARPGLVELFDYSLLDQLSEKARANLKSNYQSPTFAISKFPDTSGASAVIWYDYDLDLDFDLVFAQPNQITLYEFNDHFSINPRATIATSESFTGLLAADLFTADNPLRPRAAWSMEKLMNEDSVEPSKYPPSRHNTRQELIAWGASGIKLFGTQTSDSKDTSNVEFVVVTSVNGLESPRDVFDVEVLDIESDGDLDLIVATQSGVAILQNNGDRTFRDITNYSSLPVSPWYATRLFACDIDRDNDQDVLAISGSENALVLLENMRHSQLRSRPLDVPSNAKIRDVDVGDIDGNRRWDVVSTGDNDGYLFTTRGPFDWTKTSATNLSQTGRACRLGDFNNDGCIDLLCASQRGLEIRLGQVGVGFGPPYLILAGDAQQVDVIDQDQSGGLDIAAIVDGRVVMLSSSSTLGNFLAARVRGYHDLNGTGRINHYAVGSTLEFLCENSLQMRLIRKPVVHFGIGSSKPENLRILFENGFAQDTNQLQVNMLVEERQELHTSCPFIYGWNGERFELITDCLWNAPLGLQIERGRVMPDRRWEHLLLPGELVKPRDGYCELRITEELWEIVYLDKVELTAVYHHDDVEVFTNEKVGPESIAAPHLYFFKDKLRPQKALDGRRRNLTDKLLKLDHQYAGGFDRLHCQGLAEPHYIELDFGKLPIEKPIYLVLNGWLYPGDTSLNIGINQNPLLSLPQPPSLWIVDASGKWVCAQSFMGFPGGKPKSIVVDLQNVLQSEDHRIRIATSQQIYWDEAFIAAELEAPEKKLLQLQLEYADLHYRGFGKLLSRGSDQPHWYGYLQFSRERRWPALDGPFTKYGDVRQQLASDDDKMVVMNSGDEIILRFKAPTEKLPSGWRCDFVLHNVGWEKDGDINTLSGNGSLPLPFKSQSAYPPNHEQFEEVLRVYELNEATLKRNQ